MNIQIRFQSLRNQKHFFKYARNEIKKLKDTNGRPSGGASLHHIHGHLYFAHSSAHLSG